MNQALEWSPLAIFLVAFEIGGIYWATGALMAACVALMVIHRLRTGRYKTMHVITAGVALILGTATLVLHDKRFIQWKPTILLGGTAIAFLGSMLIGNRPLAQRMLQGVFPEPLVLGRHTWRVLNIAWAAFFALLAAANLYVAHHFSEALWVKFKVIGITAATFVFMIPQVLWLSGKVKPSAAADGT